MHGGVHGIVKGGGLACQAQLCPPCSVTTGIDGMKLFEWPTRVRAERAVCSWVHRGGLKPDFGTAAALYSP